jgi:hypothetical protein
LWHAQDDFNMLFRELAFEMKGKATDRLKTPEEIAKEEKERLEQLEVPLVTTTTTTTTISPTSITISTTRVLSCLGRQDVVDARLITHLLPFSCVA